MTKRISTFAIAVLGVISLYVTAPAIAEKAGPGDNAQQKVCTQCKDAGKADCAKKHGKAGKHRHMKGQPNTLERMTKELDLTADQQAKAKGICDEFDKQQKASFEGRRKAQQDDLNSVLTKEQKAKFESLKKQRAEKGVKDNPEQRPEPPKLTKEQKDKLKALREKREAANKAEIDAFKAKMKPILDKDQQAKLDKMFEKKPHHKMGGPGHKGPHGDPQGGPKDGRMGKKHRGNRDGGHDCRMMPPPPNEEDILNKMAEDLNLTAEQKDKVGVIFKQHKEARMERMKAAFEAEKADMEKMKQELSQVLNEEQMKKLEERPPCPGPGMMPPGGPGHKGPGHFGPGHKGPKHCGNHDACPEPPDHDIITPVIPEEETE